MGLDAFLYAYEKEDVDPPFTVLVQEDDYEHSPIEVAYWRKHYAMQEWMFSLYMQKGGNGEFNCDYVELTQEDLEALDHATADKDFYRQFRENYDDDTWEFAQQYDKYVINMAKELTRKGYVIMYYSWW